MRIGHLTIHKLQETGDTIVEVLIAITVISSVLGGAYVTTNRSLLITRDTQERSIALKLVESQVEQLKGLASTSPDTIFGVGVPASYCVTSPTTIADASNSACYVDGSGAPTTIQPQYHIMVSRSSNTFTITNQWSSLRGSSNQIQMKYRIYQ